MGSMIEAMKKRHSVRTYSSREIEENKILILKEFFSENRKGPLGSDVRFEIVDGTGYNQKELKELGTYGFIKGPKIFIAGAAKKSNMFNEDFGYCMEKNILKATDLGLGTCWLGASLNRSIFAQKMSISEDEVLPAATPLGYAEDKKTIKENIARFVAKSDKRKKPEELFFSGNIKTPMDTSVSGDYSTPLEALRIAPSAYNKQPWRIIREKDRNTFHFYLDEDYDYNNRFKVYKIQNVDIGIGMCHFELAARELDLNGRWEINNPGLEAGDLKYIVSWVG